MSQYTVHASFQVPYFHTHVPMEITMDKTTQRQFVNYHRGMDTYTYRWDLQKLYSVYPVIDTPVRFRLLEVATAAAHLFIFTCGVDDASRSHAEKNKCVCACDSMN